MWDFSHHTHCLASLPSIWKIPHSKLFFFFFFLNPGAVSFQETRRRSMLFNTLCGFSLGLEFSFCPSVWWIKYCMVESGFLPEGQEKWFIQSKLLYKKMDNTFSRGKVFVSTYWNLSTLTDMVVLTWRCSSKNCERFWYIFLVCTPDSHTVTSVCFLTSLLMRSSNFRSTECSGHFTRNCSWQMMKYQPGNWITRFPSW